MNWGKVYKFIEQIENKENDDLTFLYECGCIELQSLYRVCVDALYKAEQYNYPKKRLSSLEKRIYGHSPFFFESHLDGDYSAVFYDNKLV